MQRLRHARRSSTRSTGSATTCARPARAGLLPAADLAGERSGRAAAAPRPPADARAWVLCGFGRFGREVTEDLRAEGLDVTVVEPAPRPSATRTIVVGRRRPSRACWRSAISSAPPGSSPARTTTRPTSRWSRPPGGSTRTLFVAARQNQPASAPLFAAVEVDSLLVPAEVVAHEVYAQLRTPLLWRFLREMPGAKTTGRPPFIDRLTQLCGRSCRRCGRSG